MWCMGFLLGRERAVSVLRTGLFAPGKFPGFLGRGRYLACNSNLRSLRCPPSPAGYQREGFGSTWADIDGNGCNQRDDVLLRDAEPGSTRVEQQGSCAHDVVAGTWIDPYSGAELVMTDMKDLAQAQAVQIDHVVALLEAWVSGARGWSDDRRERFANDLEGLLAVDGPTNASKGEYDPAAWRPKQVYQCSYAQRWIAIKYRWELAVDPSEVRALQEMLAVC